MKTAGQFKKRLSFILFRNKCFANFYLWIERKLMSLRVVFEGLCFSWLKSSSEVF